VSAPKIAESSVEAVRAGLASQWWWQKQAELLEMVGRHVSLKLSDTDIGSSHRKCLCLQRQYAAPFFGATEKNYRN
jgi:hypothetical protein